MEENSMIPQENKSKYRQYLAATTANLITLSFGIAEGFPSPAIILLTNDDSILPSGKITDEDGSWIVALLCIGCLFGNIFFSYITNKFGRKWPIIIVSISTIISWLLVLFAQNVYYLFASRLLIGFFGGGTYTIVPLFLSEIAQDDVRGTVTASLVLFESLGILIAFILGAFCSFQTTPVVVIGLLLLGAVLLSFFPESPLFLVKKYKMDQAEKSIKFYQNLSGSDQNEEQLELEMDKLRRAVNLNRAERGEYNPLQWSDFRTQQARKAFIIGIFMVALNQFCGIATMLSYAGPIFRDAGSNMEPNISAIVVACIQVVGSVASTYFIDHAGRRLLFGISTIGSALGLSVLGAYKMLEHMGHSVQAFNWIPVASFGATLFVANLAVLTIHISVISEVMPEKVKDFGLSFCMSLLWIFGFIVSKFLPLLIDTITFHGSMFMFAGICLGGFAFIYSFVPETMGKSYEDIMKTA